MARGTLERFVRNPSFHVLRNMVLLKASYRPRQMDTIYLLEILRFVACLGVILYHYQHFVTFRGSAYLPNQIPFSSIFGWFLTNGGYGVQVFWCLSGIVFAHVYQLKIAHGEIGIRQFGWNRFARLYPLHLLTLTVLTVFLFVLRQTTDLENFIYQYNNAKHFFLNLIFVNYWGFQDGYSFNGPVWSVSIELIAYFVFAILVFGVRFLPNRFKSHYLFVVLWSVILVYSKFLINGPSDFLPMCIALFMVGAVMYSTWQILPNALVFASIIYFSVDYLSGGIVDRYLAELQLPFTSMMIVVFICLMGFSRLFGQMPGGSYLAKRMGGITYSMYMLHFPIQFAMVLFSENVLHLNFLSRPVFVAYFSLVIALSLLCHRKFEMPVKAALRTMFMHSFKFSGNVADTKV
jgi:peptidoglycan/LPS O-acetylase OafA/YrhL